MPLDSIRLILSDPPQLKSEIDSANTNTKLKVKADSKITLSCEVVGIPPPIVFWTKDKLPITFSKNV